MNKSLLSRRSFVKGTAGTLAFPFVVPSTVFGSQAPSNRLNIGCIGTGRMGLVNIKQVMNLGLNEKFNARLSALCDVDSNRMKKAASIVEKFYADHDLQVKPRSFKDFRQMLTCEDIDAVIIATPDHQHAVNAIAAANAGKDIYLQKPLTYSLVEGQKLVKAVRKNKVILQTGSQQRSSIYFRKVCQLVRNQRIGKLQRIEVQIPIDKGIGVSTATDVPKNLDYDMWLGPAPMAPYTEHRVHPQADFSRPGWIQIQQYCHGNVTNWGAHMYDIAQWALGVDLDSGPVQVEAAADFPDRGLFDVHTTLNGKAVYANGVEMITLNDKPGVKFIGTDGWLWVQRGSFDAHDREIFRQKFTDDKIQLYESSDHTSNFLECIRSRKEPITPVEAGHRSNSIGIIHHIAMKLKRKLKWDPVKERFIDDAEANKMLDFPHRKPWLV
jgi:predicted dehydrogenase